MTFARSERAALCDLFDAVGPEAPTLCDGWLTHDLAAHLWIRETDPAGAAGIVAKPLAGIAERRMAETKQRWEFADLVGRIRKGPARLSVFAIPGVDEGANTTEYFVHHEDVRRAGSAPAPARTLDADVEEWMWRRLKLLARAWFRRSPVGVVLERAVSAAPVVSADVADADLTSADVASAEPETIRAASGASIVTLVGRPSELMLFANGRGAQAEVELVGEPEAIGLLHGADLHI